MTLADIQHMEREYLLPVEVAEILGCDPHWIRVMARDNPKGLGFPVVRFGCRTKIPRRPFLKFMGILQ